MSHGTIRRIIGRLRKARHQPSRARRESNIWLQAKCGDVHGKVLSIGSGDDSDGEGKKYQEYFLNASTYITSEVAPGFSTELVLDVQSMPEISDGAFDCVFCSGVLEHVADFHLGIAEITRVLREDGVLLLGLPFRQAIHMPPYDYWRFTEFGIRHLLSGSYTIAELAEIDISVTAFPASYWVKARKRKG